MENRKRQTSRPNSHQRIVACIETCDNQSYIFEKNVMEAISSEQKKEFAGQTVNLGNGD